MRKLLLATALVLTTAPAFAADLEVGTVLGTTEDAIKAALIEMGWDVRKLDTEDGMIEAYAVMGDDDGRDLRRPDHRRSRRRSPMRSETITETGVGAAAPAPADRRSVRVWDPLVRLVHWGVAGAVLLNATVIEEESTAHEVIGYIAVGLVATRLVWGLVGTRHARFSAFPPNPVAALRHIAGLIRGRRKVHLSHNPAGALMVYNLWATLIGMGVTGYMMGTRSVFRDGVGRGAA